jgi:hypothetical protein
MTTEQYITMIEEKIRQKESYIKDNTTTIDVYQSYIDSRDAENAMYTAEILALKQLLETI